METGQPKRLRKTALSQSLRLGRLRKLVFVGGEDPASHTKLQKQKATIEAHKTIPAPTGLSQWTFGMDTYFRSFVGWLHRLGPHNGHQCTPLSMSKAKLTVTVIYRILAMTILKEEDRGYILISTLLRDTHHEWDSGRGWAVAGSPFMNTSTHLHPS